MTTKKDLSKGKTSSQTISISPALKEWIERFIDKKHKEYPDDERYNSVSAFYCHVMENILKIFESGKKFDDIKNVYEKEVKDFYDSLSFNALIPFTEPEVKMNRYVDVDFIKFPRILLAMRNFYKKDLKPYDYKSLKRVFEKARQRYLSGNTITKEFTLDLFREKNNKHISGVLEFVGKYSNLHYINCKLLAAFLGIFGIKINDIFFTEKDLYCRLNVITTDLLYKKELLRKERMELLKENTKFFTNYERVIKDEDSHFWMKIADDKDIIIKFRNQRTIDRWIKTIEEDLRKYGSEETFLLSVLNFFERLHWIVIENEKELKFQIKLSEEGFTQERKFLLEYLSKYGKISRENNVFYLEESRNS